MTYVPISRSEKRNSKLKLGKRRKEIKTRAVSNGTDFRENQ